MKTSSYEKKKAAYVAAAVAFVLLAGVIYFCKGDVRGSDIEADSADGTEKGSVEAEAGTPAPEAEEEASVVVHVSGAVASPGVYEVKGNMRVGDAVEAAGGFSENAAKDFLNLAQPLSDGEKITVLTIKQAKKLAREQKKAEGGAGSESEDGLVDINSASKEELMTLPGIGEAKADSIIEYREANGRFSDTEGLMEISGIKEGVYSKIAPYVTAK